jgi:glycosyltransferase involved in cell wall biosynthesis
VIFLRTAGHGSMDRYSQALGANLPVRIIDTDIYQQNSELFNVGWLSARALAAVPRDIGFTVRLRRLGEPVHLPNHHLGRYGNGLRMPYVITVHDLIRYFDMRQPAPLIHRPNSRDRVLLSLDYRGIRRATAVIAVSQTTKRDIVRHLRIPPERIFVVYEGVDHAVFRPTDRRLVEGPYVLFVGSEQPRKNLAALLHAFRMVREGGDFPELRLVKVGRPGGREAAFREETLRLIRELNLQSCVDLVGHVPDEDLPAYYAGALCVVLPSLYEGFGLPVLEAMACGCPVIVSDRGALPEIAGDAALVAKPDAQHLSEALLAVLDDGAMRESLRAAGLRRATEFSWEKAGRETCRVYDTVLGTRWAD